jgi:ribose/xylose/arabinose/galactoside ABC-type transport system permease subunit
VTRESEADDALVDAQPSPGSRRFGLIRPRRGELIPARLVPYLALIVVVVFFSLTGGTRFLSVDNASFLLQQSAIIAIPAFGESLVIIAGSIDLSVGSVVALTGTVGAVVATTNGPIAGFIAALMVGLWPELYKVFANSVLKDK